jgi:hypothetical protein
LVCATACGEGCPGCGEGDEPDVIFEDPLVPEDWVALTLGYAERLPSETQAILVARGFDELSQSFETMKTSLRSLFDLAAVESEIVNTFGVDIYRHVTFREVGIAYAGGFMIAQVLQQPVLLVYLADPEPFLARAAVVLRRQPFNLRAPRVEETVGDVTIHLYRRRTNQPAEYAVMVGHGFGCLIYRNEPDIDIAVVARAIAETTPETSLASNSELASQLERFNDYSGFLFIDPGATASLVQERMGEELDANQAYSLSKFEESVLSIAAGITLDDGDIVLSAYVSLSEEVSNTGRGMDTPSDGAAHFRRFITPGTFAALRIGANPQVLLDTILAFQPDDGGAERVREIAQPLEELLSTDLEEGLFSVITGNVMVLISRLAPLSLARAETLGDYANAFELVALLQLSDPARARELLDQMVANNEEDYRRNEDDGVIQYTARNSEDSFGYLILRDDLLILAAPRVRRRVTETSLEGTGESVEELSDGVRSLTDPPAATGLFLSFERLVPIATILGWPSAVRRALQLLESFVVTLDIDGDGFFINARLSIAPEE